MDGPLLIGLLGSLVVAAAAFLNFAVIHPDRRRYEVGKSVGWNGQQPGLRRLLIDQGRIAAVGFVGAGIQLVAIVWQASRA